MAKKGFTLTEVCVTLVILVVLAAIAIPMGIKYQKLAEFRKNESNAKTVYLAAESALTWYRSSGQWEDFFREVVRDGMCNDTFEEEESEKNGRIYAITLNSKSAGEKSPSQELVRKLLSDSIYDKDFLDAAIAVEIDIETGQVYSAFYATRCKSLSYGDTSQEGIQSISAKGENRIYGSRRQRLLGYYSTEDLANVVDLKPARLKVTTISLVNGETLSLNWSGNSRHDNLDVEYEITFYESGSQEELFSTWVNWYDLKAAGANENQVAGLKLKDREGNVIGGDAAVWYFPLTYQAREGQNGKFSLVLDAMMSPELMERLYAAEQAGQGEALAKEYSTSITRLGAFLPQLSLPCDIYAVIQTKPVYEHSTGDFREYRPGSPMRSNEANTLYQAGSLNEEGTLEAEITRFRHLSNIRCYEEQKKAVFTLNGRNLDWMASGTGLYDAALSQGEHEKRALSWQSTEDPAVHFPTIPLLSENHVLQGQGEKTRIRRLRLGEGSLPEDAFIDSLYQESADKPYSRYLGLFGEVEGEIQNLVLQDPVLALGEEGENAKAAEKFFHLYGVGILCGRSQGKLSDISVQATIKGEKNLQVWFPKRDHASGLQEEEPAAIGGMIGILAEEDSEGKLTPLTENSDAVIQNLTMEGEVTGRLPEPKQEQAEDTESRALQYQYGIGGIFGYAWVQDEITVTGCINHANMKGNLFTGGIGGYMQGGYQAGQEEDTLQPGIQDCENDGKIRCSVGHKKEEGLLEGRYFGGILGFGQNLQIQDCISAPGRYSNTGYTQADQHLLTGQYVGGIIGYGSSSQLTGCSTKMGGYILGSDYVGGIAGGLSNDVKHAITAAEGIGVTTNACYVIGNSYVGGILGKNDGAADEITISNCINNGVVAGYERYVGGIVGYNGEKGVLQDCASYLSDYGGLIFQMIVSQWKATADCAGGLAGYNNGKIIFQEASEAITVKSVSTVVVGQNFVGGVVGFNDEKGSLDVEYTLIGGRIYAYGMGAGGCIGVNTSQDILTKELEIKPSSVRGASCVGGVIGANVVDLQNDVTIGGLRANNGLGSIMGEAFTGGLIGYHRTFAKEQLQEDQEVQEVVLLERLLSSAKGEEPEKTSLLPKLGEGNIPVGAVSSQNTCVLTITDHRNTEESLQYAGNNIPIRSHIYTGGIVGYCEEESRLVLRNCRNDGNISKLSEEGESQGVSLKQYLDRGGNSPLTQEEEEELEGLYVCMAGGVISANLKNQVIDHCANTGSMNGFVGLGGIVGFNAGGIFGCRLEDHFGNGALDYIGGIAGLNLKEDGTNLVYREPKEGGREWVYHSGTIAECRTQGQRTITGSSYVGGIVGYNMTGGFLSENRSEASVTAEGDYAGGIAGVNKGTIVVGEDAGTGARTIQGMNGMGIGGIAGRNQGDILVTAQGTTGKELVAVGEAVTVTGREKVGGIAGIQEGSLNAQRGYLVCKAALIQAKEGYAGGIAGENFGAVSRAINRSGRVTANQGPAGGIVAVNQTGILLEECQGLGNVNSDNGYAGGITAENYGTVKDCSVGGGAASMEIRSLKKTQLGGICAVNHGLIEQSRTLTDVVLSGDGDTIGGITGENLGIIRNLSAVCMPQIKVSDGNLTVGGAAGKNRGQIQQISAVGLEFLGFDNYRFLGGIAGINQEEGTIAECSLEEGSLVEERGIAGNCYGGITGDNYGSLTDCEVLNLTMEIKGVYTATSTSTSAQKEKLATHIGGVAGKNEETGRIEGCLISGSDCRMEINNGMAGGVVGYNKGTISRSGDAGTKELMANLTGQPSDRADTLLSNAQALGISADDSYVSWSSQAGVSIEQLSYENGDGILAGKSLILTMHVNGSLGGITAYNAPEGRVNYCATGNWYLNNGSDAIGVGTGGIIGMNESESDQSFLLNRAFVGRQISSQDTNRFAGGIIGNQNNTTKEGWKLKGCFNYGTVYCLRTHYSGGILGQWTGTGGTIEECNNFGNLQTTYEAGWVGASGGIVAQLYHAYEGGEYNIISCGNYGNIYGRTGASNTGCANDSAGILGNITAYEAGEGQGQNYTVQVLDCVNGSGVEIYSASMASGIVGFLSCDNPRSQAQIGAATQNITLRMERCRNYAKVLKGGGGNKFVGGIFGERYSKVGAEHTYIKDCYSVNPISAGTYENRNYPIISYTTNNGNVPYLNAKDNYFLCDIGGGNSGYDSFKILEQNGYTVKAAPDNLTRADTSCIYRVDIDEKSYVARITPDSSVTRQQLTLVNDRIYGNGREIGEILFPIDKTQEPDASYRSLLDVLQKGSNFDDHVRNAYYKVEDTNILLQDEVPKGVKMQAPMEVSFLRAGSQATVAVTPADGTDPFRYTADLYVKEGEETELITSGITFYTEEYSFTLPKDAVKEGEPFVVVRAHSMFQEVESSEPVSSDELAGEVLLPSPEICIELNRDGRGYRFRLLNQEEYPQDKEWEISVKFMDGTPKLTGVPDQEGYFGTLIPARDSLQQLLVQAVPKDQTLLPSAQVPVPVYLPKDKPSITLDEVNYGRGKAKPKVTLSGTNLSDLKITVTLDAAGSGTVTTPPVYRVELMGTWTGEDGREYPDTVLLSRDILAAANGAATADFGNLPDYARNMKDWKVRIWYAQSGLGPVYTYCAATEEDANIRMLYMEEEGGEVKPRWEYAYSSVLESNALKQDCSWSLGELFQWKKPSLMEAEGGLTPEFDENNHLTYTFRWDEKPGEYQNGDRYLVSLVGVNGSSRVSLVTNQEVSGNSFTSDAQQWTYEKVELTVTSIGDVKSGRVGLSDTRTYLVGQRLPRPAQPSVENPNVNELVYSIAWSPIRPETGCGSYGIYLRPYEADGSLGLPVKLEEASVQEQEGDRYEKKLDLSGYQGQRILLYLIAQAEPGSLRYVDSLEGITYELTVPERIPTPQVTWEKSWEYDPDLPLSVQGFENAEDPDGNSLNIGVIPDKGSIPPGDSGYLLKAYVFEREEEALMAKQQIEAGMEPSQGVLTTYPAQDETGELSPVQMDVHPGNRYSHTLTGLSSSYGGKWILCSVRISSGGGQVSSQWTVNTDIWRLPYVELEKPEVSLMSQQRELEVTDTTNPDLPQMQKWQAERIAFCWDSGNLADAYYVTLKQKSGAVLNIRVIEQQENGSVAVYVQNGQTGEEPLWEARMMEQETEEGLWSFELPEYGISLDRTYTQAGITYYYQVQMNARLEVRQKEGGGYTYTLLLPDAQSLTTEGGVSITETDLTATSSVSVRADVAQNAPDLFPGQPSDAYRPSKETETSLGN